MAYTMTIAGVAFSPSSIKWNYSARNRGTANIDIPYRTNGSISRPAVDNEVIVFSGATRLFAGRIIDIEEKSFVTPDAVNKAVQISIVVSDYNLYTTRMSVHGAFYGSGSFTRKQILQDLLTATIGTYFGTTLDASVTNGPTFDDLRFDNVTVEDVLNHITTLTQEIWYIDENNVLQCHAVGATSTGLSLTESNTLVSQVQYQRTQYANIVNLVAGPEDSHEVTDSFASGSSSYTLTPYNYVSSRGYVIETTGGSDAYLPLGAYGVDPTVWTIDTTVTPPVLHRTSSLPGGTTATFTYTAKFPFSVQGENATEVSGRGPWEINVRAEGIIEYDAALAYATALANQMSVNARILVNLELRNPSVLVPRPGQTLTLALSTRGVSSATYVIASVDFDFEVSRTRTMRQRLVLTSGSSLPRLWQDFFSTSGGSGGGLGGVLTGDVATFSSGMFDTDVIANAGEADEVGIRRNTVGTTSLIANSSCFGPALSLGNPAAVGNWAWAIIANYAHLASGISGSSGRRALCFLYVPNSGAAKGAMSITQDTTGTADVFYVTPENPGITLNIGAPSSAISAGFRVNVYADSIDASTVTASSFIVGSLVSTFGNKLSYDGSNQLFIGIPGTTSAKKVVFIDSSGNSVATISALGLAAFSGGVKSSSPTDGVGYTTGAGGTVTQTTSKSSTVTLNKTTGQVTMNNAALAGGGTVAFTVSNSSVASTDVVITNVVSGGTADAYRADVTSLAAGSFTVTVQNLTGGSLSESPVIGFAVIKGATS